MVVLHVKWEAGSPPPSSSTAGAGEEEMEFLYESAAASAPIADVASALAGIAAVQARLLFLCRVLRGRCAEDARPAAALERALSEAEAYASKEQVRHNRFLSPRALREHIKNIEKTASTVLKEPPQTLYLQQPTSDFKHESVQLWWAGKELSMGKKLSDYIGTNDKTKIVIKLRQAPNGP